jgi:uncharacterized coiled-coil protein SlyX
MADDAANPKDADAQSRIAQLEFLLAEHKHQLAEHKHQLAEHKHQLAEHKHQLAEQDNEIKRLKQENTELHRRSNITNYLSRLAVKSHAVVYSGFTLTAKVDPTMQAENSVPTHALHSIWKECVNIPGRPSKGDLEWLVQDYMTKVFATVFAALKFSLKASDRPHLPASHRPGGLIPDFVIHPRQQTQASWANALVFVEVEACETNRNTVGFGQAISYLARCQENHFHSMDELNPLVWCTYTNGSEIEIGRVLFDEKENTPYGLRSGALEFLPAGKLDPNEPTLGFMECSNMSVTGQPRQKFQSTANHASLLHNLRIALASMYSMYARPLIILNGLSN